MPAMVSRRQLLAAARRGFRARRLLHAPAAPGGVFCARSLLDAQQAPPSQGAPTVVSNPPRDFGPNGAPTTYFTDPDILVVDPAFGGLVQVNSSIKRLWIGALWAEGPAWNSVGRYLIWSDIPNNVQMRWLEDDGHVTVFRNPSNNSNGNTFDFQGRQLSCEHTGRRIARYEHDGSITAVAESYMGQRLNSPNDVAPHRDGSYWFTDPPAGFTLYEGAPEVAGAPGNADGRSNPRPGK